MVAILDKKLWRDVLHLRGQVITIALVMAAGVAAFVGSQSTWRVLEGARESYYDEARFSDVFASLEHAPTALRARLEAIPGVAEVELRIVEQVTLPLADMPLPARGRIVSIPAVGTAQNRLYLRRGRLPRSDVTLGADEVVLIESFAEAHHIEPGDTVPVILNGVLRHMHVVGIGLSPEYVFAIGPTEFFPSPGRFAVLWMNERAAAAAFRKEGAFNDVAIRLAPGASLAKVEAAVDRLLEPYGGAGAYGRERQTSEQFLRGELEELRGTATVVPAIFLAVAAFLVHVVLSRLVQLQRAQIATLRAVGYRARTVAAHYLKLATLIVAAGVGLGVGLGALIGKWWIQLYTRFFHFPVFHYHLHPVVILAALLVSFVAAAAGALTVVRQVARLAPAEAMQPPSPPSYRRTFFERLGIARFFSPEVRMVMREIERRPTRLVLSVVGIGLAVAILVVGRFVYDVIDYFLDVQFQMAQHEDMAVVFRNPVPKSTIEGLDTLPGVITVEGLRVAPARFRRGAISREGLLTAYPGDVTLRQIVQWPAERVALPPEGILLTRKLAEILHTGVGDTIEVELLSDQRQRRQVTIAGLVDEPLGLQGHMRLDVLAHLLGEEPLVNEALLTADPKMTQEVDERVRDIPQVVGVVRRQDLIQQFRQQTGESLTTTAFILTLFASTIAVGVVYNNARVALSLRSRDLASLRVLGFSRREVSAILLGELAVQVLLALPVGFGLGRLLAHGVAALANPEVYRLPIVISGQTYAFAAAVVLAAAALSGWLVRRGIDQLDLVGVLKTRE